MSLALDSKFCFAVGFSSAVASQIYPSKDTTHISRDIAIGALAASFGYHLFSYAQNNSTFSKTIKTICHTAFNGFQLYLGSRIGGFLTYSFLSGYLDKNPGQVLYGLRGGFMNFLGSYGATCLYNKCIPNTQSLSPSSPQNSVSLPPVA